MGDPLERGRQLAFLRRTTGWRPVAVHGSSRIRLPG
jgi:hypothetical protein